MGTLLFVDLNKGSFSEEQPRDKILTKYLGGYIFYTRQKAKVDPLGPQAMLGFVSGPLSGTDAITGNRYQVVGKSPKTGTWGDGNSGGTFATPMKQAGLDGIFFTGISEGWDPQTGVPTRQSLERLGLDFVAKDLHG